MKNRNPLALVGLLAVGCGAPASFFGDDPAAGAGGAPVEPGVVNPSQPVLLFPVGEDRAGGTRQGNGVEDCIDLWDNDGDGLVDCQDPDCSANCSAGSTPLGGTCTVSSDCAVTGDNVPVCLDWAYYGFPGGYCSELCTLDAPGACAGGACFDIGLAPLGICFETCTGPADCDRGSCVDAHTVDPLQPNQPICYPWETVCNDAADDDGDETTDCDDTDCAASPWCLVNDCASAADYDETLLAPTAGAPTGHGFEGSCVGSAGVEAIFTFVAPESTTYVATVDSASDYGIYVLSGCGAGQSEVACADASGAGAQESVTFWADAGVPLHLVVDGVGSSDDGPFDLLVSPQ